MKKKKIVRVRLFFHRESHRPVGTFKRHDYVCAIRELECRLLGDGLNPFSSSYFGFGLGSCFMAF